VVTPDRGVVVDFKTDQPALNKVFGVAARKHAQMAAYLGGAEAGL